MPSIAWGSLLVVLVVSFGSAVAVVVLVSFAMVGLSAREASADGPSSGISPGAGTAIAGLCLAVVVAIVAIGLYTIIV